MANWKSALYEYVHVRNQTDIHYSPEPLLSLVKDTSVLRERESYLRRLSDCHNERGLVPRKNETRLRLHSVDEQPDQVIAELDLRKTYHYELGGILHEEERIEQERVSLRFDGARWLIWTVKVHVPEKSELPDAALIPQPHASMSVAEPQRTQSLPFINRRLVHSPVTAKSKKAYYDRDAACRYADAYWNHANPAYQEFPSDCTNYVSQCLYAGGAPMNNTGRRETGWWYEGKSGSKELWSYSWSVSHSLQSFLKRSTIGLRADEVSSPLELSPGDVICYDWNGDGGFEHSVIVTDLDADGFPLVNARTVSSRRRFWDYRDSYAWTPKTVYRFLRISDVLQQ
ncbi:amidase domain-containing protein [Paenibacillus sp. y28]|uniref:amidase domain-containing protein n=1 Tax=Paenibacillus sp. y28 TaxID=3129110 RepID=UPI003016632C